MAELHAVEPAAADTQSWDDFWQDVSPVQRTETICGVEVLVPTDMPLNLQARLEELEQSESEEDLHELVSLLFGEGALADWIAAGMTMRQFQTALAWGLAHANGQAISFREAHERVQAAEAGQGKAVPANRAARRAAVRSRSASTGGRSARTSAASTASPRKGSQG